MIERFPGETIAVIRSLEESLWQEGTRFDREHMESILAPSFVEFGRSGCIYDRNAILATPRETIDAQLPLPNLEIRAISATVALVTYDSHVTTERGTNYAHRSSVWSQESGAWQLYFHQGTPFKCPKQ